MNGPIVYIAPWEQPQADFELALAKLIREHVRNGYDRFHVQHSLVRQLGAMYKQNEKGYYDAYAAEQEKGVEE